MKIGDLYYNPEKNELVEITDQFDIWMVPTVSYYNAMTSIYEVEVPCSEGFPFITLASFKKSYRKIGVL